MGKSHILIQTTHWVKRPPMVPKGPQRADSHSTRTGGASEPKNAGLGGRAGLQRRQVESLGVGQAGAGWENYCGKV